MIRYENHCVGCPSDMGCLGRSCRYMDVPVCYCDECGNYAEYHCDDRDYCEQCLIRLFENEFRSLSIDEMAELLNENFYPIENN